MEYNAEKTMSFKTPHPDLKLKYLKIDAIRIAILRKHISSDRHYAVLHKSITDYRVIMNKKRDTGQDKQLI